MKHYLETVDAVFQEVQSSEAGLTSQEAAARLERNGKNKLKEAKKDSMLKRFFNQMKDPMIIILLVAAVISAVTEMYIQHYMFMTQQYYAKVFGSTISQDTLMVDIAGDVQVSRAFQKEIVNDDRVSGVQFYDTILENFKSMVNSLDLIVWALIISSMSLAFVVLGNLTNINISERQREIATLKVLGFRKKEVEDYIFKENNVLTGLGALAGIPIGQVLHHFIMRQVEMDYVMFGRSVDPSSNVIAFFMTILFGVLVNFFMRKRLQSIEMVESLKSVE